MIVDQMVHLPEMNFLTPPTPACETFGKKENSPKQKVGKRVASVCQVFMPTKINSKLWGLGAIATEKRDGPVEYEVGKCVECGVVGGGRLLF